jgi:hypothetical protein
VFIAVIFSGNLGIVMVDIGLFLGGGGEKSPKRRHCPKFSPENPLFFLKSIRQIAPLFFGARRHMYAYWLQF